MKLKILSLVLVLATMLSITSCSMIATLQLDKAKQKLRDNEYSISIAYDNYLEEGVVEKLEAHKNGDYITITKYKNFKHANLVYKAKKHEYEAAMKYIELQIETAEYVLKTYKEDLSASEIANYSQLIKDLNSQIDQLQKSISFGISGNIIWSGTLDAAKDAGFIADSKLFNK